MSSVATHIAESHGTDLSSRQRASQLRDEIVNAIELSGHRFVIDFANVRTVSDSFADELFGILVATRGEQWFKENISLINISTHVRDTLVSAIYDRVERREVQDSTSFLL